MHSNRRTSIIVVGGALAIASIGYGLGTQADDGTALAGDRSDRSGAPGLMFERGSPPGFDTLADKLGVDADRLEEALRAFHEQEDGDRRDEFASALARALDIPVAKVTAAFDQLRAHHETRFANRLAEALGVDTDKVRAALDELHDDGDGPVAFGDFAGDLADELGLEENDVSDALMEIRPERGHVRRHAMPLRQLASALDVSRADLRKALRAIRPGGENGWKQHNEALAKFLAERLDLDVDKVSDALPDLPRPTPPPHGGRPGPGGPGAFGPPA